MVTFMLICIAIVAIAVMLVCCVIVAGGILAGPLLVIVDVLLGITPFVLVFLLIRWLLKRR